MVTANDMTSADSQDPQRCRVVLAGSVAKRLLSEVQEGLVHLGRAPLLVGFLANDDPAARMYANWTRKTCEEKYAWIELDRWFLPVFFWSIC